MEIAYDMPRALMHLQVVMPEVVKALATKASEENPSLGARQVAKRIIPEEVQSPLADFFAGMCCEVRFLILKTSFS